jgi:hypothetical protein
VEKSKFPVMTFPLRGEWVTINTPGHHRFAFDLVAVEPNSKHYFSSFWSHRILGSASVSTSYSWSQPLYSPVSGTVLTASDGCPDRMTLNIPRDLLKTFVFHPTLIDGDIRPFAGNHILLESSGAFVLLAHLRCSSLKVSPGDTVQTNQLIGEIGNSGNAIAPHLHIQVMDTANPLTATIIPFGMTGCEVWDSNIWKPMNGEPLKKHKHFRSTQEPHLKWKPYA